MKERKQTKQTPRVKRGQTLATSSSDAIAPAQHTSMRARSLEPSQKSVGANQNRQKWNAAATACR